MKNQNVSHKFNDLQSLLDYANKPCEVKKSRRASITEEPSKRWDLNTDLPQSLELMQSGWKEGAEKVSDFHGEISGAQSTDYIPLPEMVPSELGEMIEPSEYFAGNPECFYHMDVVERKMPVVKIGLILSIAGGYNSKDLINRGVAMLGLVDLIEKNRINTELWGVFHFQHAGRNNGASLLYEVCIKPSNTPFDIDRLAFICAHPAFFRRIIFCAMEQENKETRMLHDIGDCGRGYSYPSNYSSKDYDLIPDYDPDSFKDTASANKWIKKNAIKAGIQIDE